MDIFTVTTTSHGSRNGLLKTRKGTIATPFFMPDATRGSVRGLTNNALRSVGVSPLVVNTYHLMLQPTASFLAEVGGIHTFMQWDGPLLTDSGGYQVYSLIHKNPAMGKITEEGATFRSVLDGSVHILTPQKAIQTQFDIGSDMMVVLDDPRPTDASRSVHEAAVERTVRWAKQCKSAFEKECVTRGLDETERPLLFAVVQGGPYVDLRERCAQKLQEMDFDGYGFGGRHIDADGTLMYDVVVATATALPEDKPRFALGIGTPRDIVTCYHAGWDMFDCVIPTREGRHGRAFLFQSDTCEGDFYEVINITNERFTKDMRPLSSACDCPACTEYSRAYIKHLFRVNEPLGGQLVALHNLFFFTTLMKRLRNT